MTTTVNDIIVLVQPIVNDILDVAVGIGVGWIGYLYHRITNANLDTAARNALHSAAMTAATSIEEKLEGGIRDNVIGIHSPAMFGALDWVRRSVPDAMKRFHLTDDAVAQLIISKIGLLRLQAPADTVAVVATPAPIAPALTPLGAK